MPPRSKPDIVVEEMPTPTVAYSEIFRSIEGEGMEAGQTRVFLRLAGCNFRCAGFNQQATEDTSLVDPLSINELSEFPSIDAGCDSIYSVDPKYKHLWKRHLPTQIAEAIRQCLVTKSNTSGQFEHPESGMSATLSVTGGEPMLQQRGVSEIIDALEDRCNRPGRLNIETNGTRPLQEVFRRWIVRYQRNGGRALATVSPKLSLSGETQTKAVRPDVVSSYATTFAAGQLKFVVDDADDTWAEMAEVLKRYRKAGVLWPVFVMPVGGSTDLQERIQRKVAERAIENGYAFSARVHCWVFNNEIGT